MCVCVGRDENKKPTSVIMRRVERIRIESTVETWRRDMKVNGMVEDEKLRGSAQVDAQRNLTLNKGNDFFFKISL